MSDIASNMFEAVENIVARQIDSTPIDLTVTADVVLVANIEVGEYKVTYKGDTFSAFSLDPLTVYKKGEEVYVLIPKGDFSSKKIILGKAAYNDSVSYADRQAMSNQWKTRGPNWLANEWYWRDNTGNYRLDNNERRAGIIATTKGQENLITGPANQEPNWREYVFNRDADTNPPPDEPPLTPMRLNKITRPLGVNRPDAVSLQKVDTQFQVYANVFEHVMISANFETNFSMVHFSGEYGVLVECWADNPKYGKENYPNEPARILTTLRFAFNDFNGAPYQFNQATPQRAVFPVPKGVLKGLVRVCLFQDDGWDTDIVPIYITTPSPEVSFDPARGATPVRDRNNIRATNIDIRWCEGINLEDSLFWLRIDAPKGTSLYHPKGTIPANPSLPLEARLFYGSEEVTAQETCKFIWFRQKYSATMDKVDRKNDKDEFGRTWWDYGGNGWAPIDKIMESPADEPFFGESANGINQYSFKVPDWQQTLNVGIEVVPWQWRYKVVCVYNPTARNIDDKLVRDSREVILFETELVTNESSIHDFELPLPMVSNDLLTTYLRTRNNTLAWEQRIAYDPQNPNTPDPSKDWWCRWWMETPSGLYEPVPHTGVPRFQKGKITINDYLHYDAITFKAQVYGKKTPVGGSPKDQVADAAQLWPWSSPQIPPPDQTFEYNEFEIANIERTLLKSEDLTLLVDWDGITHHSYNADGSILLQSSVGMEFPLRAILHWSDASIMDYAIEWIAPDGITPLRHHSTYPGGEAVGSGFAMNDSMMYDMWVGADNIIRYKVNQKYDINKTENTFTLQITLIDGRVFKYTKEITFSKAGQNGTQGSEWEARIWPTNENAQVVNSVGFERFTEEIRVYPRPLVVNGNFNGTGSLTRNLNFKLFLRPFIYKNGKRIEELADADQYSYKVYWDSRYPNVKDSALVGRYKARYGSFLEFMKFNGQGDANLGGKGMGTVSPTGTPRLQSFTQSVDTVGGSPTDSRTYGAVEVRWRDVNVAGTGASVADVKYDFIIKGQVDIFKQGVLIATIFSYWPVDILFTNGAAITPAVFDPNKIKTNWPQFVLYNPTGYGPEVHQDHLRFFYGDKAWNEFDPLPFTATPENLSTTIQNIKPENNSDIKSWRLYPRPYYFFEECANGSMRANFTTPTGEIGWASPNPDMVGWQGCTYVRPIVYMLNAYGNTDINGWDGKSIDLNDERGTVFAPTVGAGFKDPFTNTFSGVIMGIDTSQSKQLYQNMFGGFSNEDIQKNPYMTGLFGYQGGVSSFGIMENGTAYFGRADRGGRIIIDGYNAQIYGGNNTTSGGGDMNGNRDMDMHNRMRLSFIDFSGVAYEEDQTGVMDVDNDPIERPSLDTDEMRINPGAYDVRGFYKFFVNQEAPDAAKWAGFGSGRGAGTPAIEIGSYDNYMKGGANRKGADLIKEITPTDAIGWYGGLIDLEIPGHRKFLVTYDGTLFAMNAFIKGNIVGSNIIGSQFFNLDGSFGVTADGNMYVGSGYNSFKETFMEGLGVWSKDKPTLGSPVGIVEILSSSNPTWTSLPPNPSATNVATQVDAPFFVANDGRVFCQEIHISGRSSINIGGFHVVANQAGAGNEGDVYSFGTMWLVGSENKPAVEAWGHFYLRGTLVNLGHVFLGSSYEKIIGTGGTSANSQNSPLSIMPTLGSGGANTSTPAFPIKAAFWPLYFHTQSTTVGVNDCWTTLSASADYMPDFSTRPSGSGQTFMTNHQGGAGALQPNTVWRVDRLGMWTDAIIFTSKPLANSAAANFESNGFLFMGWWDGNGSSAGGAKSFAIKNINAAFPSMTIESLNYMHISSGKDLSEARNGSATSTMNTTIIDAWKPNYGPSATDNDFGATLALTGSNDVAAPSSAVISATTVGFSGRSTDRSELQAFFYINGIRATHILKDEAGRLIDRMPAYETNSKGILWIKGLGMALDGSKDFAQVSGYTFNSTIRINRSFSGDIGMGAGGLPADVDSKRCIAMSADGMVVQIKEVIHIIQGTADNAAGQSEFYLKTGGIVNLFAAGILKLGSATETHVGVGMTGGHGTVPNMIKMTTSIISFEGAFATPDNQKNIYARFG